MKILVIANNPFSKISNNGKTLEAIFSAFKRNELCQLFIRPGDNDIDFDFCSSYYLITDKNLVQKFKNPFITIGNEITNLEVTLDNSVNLKSPVNAFSWKRVAREYLWKFGLWKNQNLHNWLISQSPDLIFFVGGNSGFVYDIASYISDFLNINIVSFFTDDYIIHPIRDNFYSKLHWHMLRKKYAKILNSTVRNYCIGTKMAKEYTEYFSAPFSVIMNLINIGEFNPKITNTSVKSIVYLGGLHLHRWKTISKLASYLPSDVKVHVYTFQPIVGEIKDAFDCAGVCYHPGLSGDALQKVIIDSDVLLHVESDDPKYKAITMLSVSTKIPEYLVSSRPILAVGPSEVASMQLLSQNSIGYVIDSKDANLKYRIDEFLNDSDLRFTLLSRGFEYVKQNFDIKIKSEEFRKDMMGCLED